MNTTFYSQIPLTDDLAAELGITGSYIGCRCEASLTFRPCVGDLFVFGDDLFELRMTQITYSVQRQSFLCMATHENVVRDKDDLEELLEWFSTAGFTFGSAVIPTLVARFSALAGKLKPTP